MGLNESIAIAHKDYAVRGGGEVLAERMARIFDAPLYVGRRGAENECEGSVDIREIPLSRFDKWAIDRGGIARTAAYMLRWQAAADQLHEYDTVITSGNEPLWYVGPDEQTIVAYTHSTPRFMYDLYPTHQDFSGISGRVKALFYASMRAAYESNVRRPDLWVANSDLVARRIQKYWNIPPEQIRVVYPPVDTHNYAPGHRQTENYYLHLGRLAGHKRVHEVIEAFNQTNARLIVAGKGPERDRLESMARDNIEFVGYVPETEKRQLYAGAKALIYPPRNEDFGMVPIEAMASGTPVIGVDEGFTQYQVMHGENGLLFDRGRLIDAVETFESARVGMSEREISEWATEWFGVDRFRTDMHAAVSDAQMHSHVTVPWKGDRADVTPTPEVAETWE